MRYVDIHTHLNLAAFADDYRAAAYRAFEAGVSMINVGTMYETSRKTLDVVREVSSESLETGGRAYATVGLHPTHTSVSHHDVSELGDFGKTFTSRGEVFDYGAYKHLAEDPAVVAIGECGLDFYRETDEAAYSKQREAFEMQIALANELGKPLMLHLRSGNGRNAYREAYAILQAQAKVRGNSHFFAGSYEDAKLFWDMGYSTSFTGVITFTGAYDEVVRAAPGTLIHAETDAPYVAPTPHRGTRNEPLFVRNVVLRMALLRGVAPDAMAAQLRENARDIFAI